MTKEMEKLIKLSIISNKQDKVYPNIVEKLIREKYTLSQELSIQRQRDTKPNEFEEYNAYCEACKTHAKELLKIKD